MKKYTTYILFLLLCGCGFHLQGPMQLVPPLHTMYIQTSDPYGSLALNLRQYLKMSNVVLVSSPAEASTVLVILQDNLVEELLSVSSTQQTRQYTLKVVVVFAVNDAKGRTIVPPQTLIEARTITVQSNQILGSSNEANLYYQQMHRSIAYAMMNRLNSRQIGSLIMSAFKDNG